MCIVMHGPFLKVVTCAILELYVSPAYDFIITHMVHFSFMVVTQNFLYWLNFVDIFFCVQIVEN